MELPVEHELLLDNLLDLPHAPLIKDGVLVKFLTPASGLQGYWDLYPIDMVLRPPCMVLSTIGISKDRMLNGTNIWNLPVSYNKLCFEANLICAFLIITIGRIEDPYIVQARGNVMLQYLCDEVIVSFRDGWFPFNSPDGNGNLDVAFLFVSAIKILGCWATIHSSYYYLTIQMVDGLFQPTGCPLVVAMIRNWFCKEEATYNEYLECSHIYWEPYGVLSRINIIEIRMGSVNDCSCVPIVTRSSEIILGNKDEVLSRGKEDEELNKPLSRSNREEESAVGFRETWRIPGVAPFAFCLFLESGNLSTLFDVKGVVGGILTGYISDQFDDRAITAASFIESKTRVIINNPDGEDVYIGVPKNWRHWRVAEKEHRIALCLYDL
ncbi:hypothetical protein H5410_036517 [Solanum commersonii]|uniref:Uncharacterized protein n=1 Tax=Solanum commersonii TaxID=4109 RepID=A0A9J5Y521_SOLCO|nr:hypothetical protein H5410_036517 [Solanum commersonii]